MGRSFHFALLRIVTTCAAAFACGCAATQPPPSAVPAALTTGQQLARTVPSLKGARFSTLLDFESSSDDVFVVVAGGNKALASDRAHTGRGSLRLDPQSTRMTVKLGSLLAGRPFPADWTLAGAYFYSEQPMRVRVGFLPSADRAADHVVDVPAGAWTPVFVDVPRDTAGSGAPALLAFDIESNHGALWCDDVMLVNNVKEFTGPAATYNAGDDRMAPWKIWRRGFEYIGEAPGRFQFSLVTAEASPTGWTLEEANALRARFSSPHSEGDTAGKTLTVYTDGRAYWDGQYKPMSAAGRDTAYAEGHQSPGQIEISETMGRVERNTAGDANNDGYNEATGSYRIAAQGPRVELRLIPQSAALLRPVLEFSGLPQGKPLVTLEGRLVEGSTRAADGHLLVVLPARIDRAVTIDVRIEG